MYGIPTQRVANSAVVASGQTTLAASPTVGQTNLTADQLVKRGNLLMYLGGSAAILGAIAGAFVGARHHRHQ